MKQVKIAVLGGGTGSFTVLQSLKEITSDISAIVNMCDDGGSTGQLRDELGVLPPGDARQCLVALSDAPEVRDLFSYRFETGKLSGHSLGNLILSGLELQHGGFEEAVEVAGRVLGIRGSVLPVVLGDHKLVLKDGETTVVGQDNIANHRRKTAEMRVSLEPYTLLNPRADAAIRQADVVVIAPGAFYYSILPVLSVNGVAEALQETKGRVVMFANLVNTDEQTDGWYVTDYLREVEDYIGQGVIDDLVFNSAEIPDDLLKRYAKAGDRPVLVASEMFVNFPQTNFRGEALLSKQISLPSKGDKLAFRRTYIRHDPELVKQVVEGYLV